MALWKRQPGHFLSVVSTNSTGLTLSLFIYLVYNGDVELDRNGVKAINIM